MTMMRSAICHLPRPGRRFLWLRRHADGEGRPAAPPDVAGAALEVDGAPILGDDAVADRQAQARALAHPLGGEEGVIDPLAQLLGDAAAVVGHLHADQPLPLAE